MIFITFCFIGSVGLLKAGPHSPQNTWELLDVSLDLGRELQGRVGFVIALSCSEQAGINPAMCAQLLGG